MIDALDFFLIFLSGGIAGWFSHEHRGALSSAWGRARGLVFGAAPAREPEYVFQDFKDGKPLPVTEIGRKAPEVTETATPKIDFGRAAANVTGFVLHYWKPIALIVLALLILGLMRGCSLPFDWGKSKGELRLERELAEANTRIAQHEARLGQLAGDLAVNTERDRTRRATVIAQAEQEIEDGAAQVDPDRMYDGYVRGYVCLLNPEACASGPDPAPGRSPPVRGSGPDAA